MIWKQSTLSNVLILEGNEKIRICPYYASKGKRVFTLFNGPTRVGEYNTLFLAKRGIVNAL